MQKLFIIIDVYAIVIEFHLTRAIGTRHLSIQRTLWLGKKIRFFSFAYVPCCCYFIVHSCICWWFDPVFRINMYTTVPTRQEVFSFIVTNAILFEWLHPENGLVVAAYRHIHFNIAMWFSWIWLNTPTFSLLDTE